MGYVRGLPSRQSLTRLALGSSGLWSGALVSTVAFTWASRSPSSDSGINSYVPSARAVVSICDARTVLPQPHTFHDKVVVYKQQHNLVYGQLFIEQITNISNYTRHHDQQHKRSSLLYEQVVIDSHILQFKVC